MLLSWNEPTRYPSDSLKEKSSRRIFLVHRFHYLVTVIAPGSVSFVANTHVRGPRAVWGRLTLQTRNAAGCGPGKAKRDPRGKPLFTKNEREREVYLLPRETPILASLIDAHVNLSLRRLYAVLPSGYLRTEGRYFRLEGILERFRANIPSRRGAIMRDRFPFWNRGLVFWGKLFEEIFGDR